MRDSTLLKRYISEIIKDFQPREKKLDEYALREFAHQSFLTEEESVNSVKNDRKQAKVTARENLINSSEKLADAFVKSLNRHVINMLTQINQSTMSAEELQQLESSDNVVVQIPLESGKTVVANFDSKSMTVMVNVDFKLSELLVDSDDLAISLKYCSPQMMQMVDESLSVIGFDGSLQKLSRAGSDDYSYSISIPFKMSRRRPVLDMKSQKVEDMKRTSFRDSKIPKDVISSFQKAVIDYEMYDITVTKKFYGTGKRTGEWSSEEKEKEKESKGYSTIDLGYDLAGNTGRWIKWPKMIDSLSTMPYKEKFSSKDDDVATGAGEKWLASMFGGSYMGPSTSYDLEIKGKKYECKELTQEAKLARPGTHGIKAAREFREDLDEVMKNIKIFSEYLKQKDFGTKEESSQISLVLNKISNFINESYEKIVGAGEIGVTRMKYVVTIIDQIKSLLKEEDVSAGKDPSSLPAITLRGAGRDARDFTVKVSKKKYLRIVDILEKDLSAEELEKAREHIWSTAARYLTSKVFDQDVDTEEWMDELFEKVEVEKVFPSDVLSGVFIVNPIGFYLIPIGQLKQKLKFVSISQGRPKFEFSDFDAIESAGEIVDNRKS